MAREKVGDELLRVRFPNGTFDRIDLISGNRSDFVRSAVAAALGGDVAPTSPVEKSASAIPDAPKSAAPVGKVAAKPEPAVVEKPAVERSDPAPKKSFDNSARKVVTGIPSREEDKEAVLAYARERRAGSRDISLAMGWSGLRYANAERALLNEGRIAFVGSVMVCI